MKINRTLELLKQYGHCPCCGNHYVGGGEGTLVIDERTFTRTCKCGFSVTVEEGTNDDGCKRTD